MKNKRTETEKINAEKKKKRKNDNNEEEDKKSDSYEEYRVEKLDLISITTEEDIETKMKKLIEIKKKGGNLEEYNRNELNKIQFKKLTSNKPKIPKEETKQQQKEKEDNLIKIKNGLNNFVNCFTLIKLKQNAFQKLILYSKKSKEKKKKKNKK